MAEEVGVKDSELSRTAGAVAADMEINSTLGLMESVVYMRMIYDPPL